MLPAIVVCMCLCIRVNKTSRGVRCYLTAAAHAHTQTQSSIFSADNTQESIYCMLLSDKPSGFASLISN